jgi:hypothetical protein
VPDNYEVAIPIRGHPLIRSVKSGVRDIPSKKPKQLRGAFSLYLG